MRLLILLLRYISGTILLLIRIISFGKLPPPLPTVSVVIIKGGKILGLSRSDGLGIGLPGGLINWSEEPEQALLRETLEETGLVIEVKKLLGVYSHFEKSFGLNSINLVYSGKIKSGKLKSSYEGEVDWYLPNDFLVGGAKNIINDLSVQRILNVGT